MKNTKNKNLKKRLKILIPGICFFLLLAGLLLGYILPQMKNELIKEKRSKIKSIIDVTVTSLHRLNEYQEQGIYTLDEVQSMAKAQVKSARYGDEGKDYMWINDFKPNMIMHPFKASLDGKYIGNVKDPEGKRLFIEMVDVVKDNGSGYVTYMWQYKDNANLIVPKISYVKSFGPWKWIVGTGLYIQDIEEEVGALQNKVITFLIILMIIFIIMIIVLTRQVMKSTKATIEASISFIKQINEPLFVVDNDLLIHYINKPALDTFGYTEEEVIGKMTSDNLLKSSLQNSDNNTLKQSINTKKEIVTQVVAYTKDGTAIPVRESCNVLLDDDNNVIGGFEIISDIRILDEGFLNNMADPAFRTDTNLVIQNINNSALTALGYTEQEVIGKMTCEDLIKTPSSNKGDSTIKQCIDNKETIITETTATTKNGTNIPVRAACGCLTNANGEVTGGFEVITDLTAFVKMVETTEKVASGDLTVEVDESIIVRTDTVGKLAQAMKKMVGDLKTIITNITISAQNLSQAVQEISSGNENLSQRTSEQASTIEEIASTIEEATSTINQNADNSDEANKMAKNSLNLAEDGGQIVTDSIKSMADISNSSKKIGEIISVINEIAFQTNLLALNAAVEAARAGEQGRGFAVVAGEVRNLAQRAGNAAKEIEELIKDSIEKVTKGTGLSEKSGDSLKDIIQGINNVTTCIAEIAAASNEQKQGMNQINVAITEMDSMTQQNASLVEQTASASEEMASQAQELVALVENFTIDEIDTSKYHTTATLKKEPIKAAPEEIKKVAPSKIQTSGQNAGDKITEILSSDGFEEF